MDLGLKGKIVLVTGSSRGIGRAIAEDFLAEGSQVILTSRKASDLKVVRKDLIESYSERNVLAFPCDFTKTSDIAALKQKIVVACGGLDIVVANVGSGRSFPDLIAPKPHFQRLLDINLTSAIDTARTFYPLLKKSRGVILFISSIAGMEATGSPVDYATAKTALLAFSKNLARKSAADGVRANCLAPGNILFPGGRWEELLRREPARVRRMLTEAVPMGKFGKPKDISSAAVFLCSQCASFITGAVLVVDGGQTATLF